MRRSKPNLMIRSASAEDISQMLRIERATSPDPLNDWQLRRWLKDKASCWIVVTNAGGEVLAHLHAQRVKPRALELVFIGVLPEWQRSGLGSRLMTHLLQMAIEHELRIVGCVPESNLAALLWLKALGIPAVGLKPDEFVIDGVRQDGVRFCWRPPECSGRRAA